LLNRPDKVADAIQLFTCTMGCHISEKLPLEATSKMFHDNLKLPIVAMHSNYFHHVLPGYAEQEKKKKKTVEYPTSLKQKTRKKQGDGTCFGSAIEPAVLHPVDGGIYRMRYFPSSGVIQVTGVHKEDLSDGKIVIELLVQFISELIGKQVSIVNGFVPVMMNYKFKLLLPSPRVIINLVEFGNYMLSMERNNPKQQELKDSLVNDGWTLIEPPFNIIETCPPIEITNLKFKVRAIENKIIVNSLPLASSITSDGLSTVSSVMPSVGVIDGQSTKPLQLVSEYSEQGCLMMSDSEEIETISSVESKSSSAVLLMSSNVTELTAAPIKPISATVIIFPSGKINVLGSSLPAQAKTIHDFINQMFIVNWHKLICLIPSPSDPPGLILTPPIPDGKSS
jgi:hypothetical protein